jgi:hypothetical protein
MNNKGKLDLFLKKVMFYSELDEKFFFEWANAIVGAVNVNGCGDEIVLHLDMHEIDEWSLREIISLHERYKIDMRNLLVFDDGPLRGVLRNSRAYWHEQIYGGEGRKA